MRRLDRILQVQIRVAYLKDGVDQIDELEVWGERMVRSRLGELVFLKMLKG